MRGKLITYCEQCGGGESHQDFTVFHCLTFCCVDCRDDYRTAHEAAREQRLASAKLSQAADDMRGAPAARSRRARAA
jgi:hypothetical protein